MITERDFHFTIIEYLKSENETELENIIKQSKVVYDYQWEFSGIISYQRKMYVEIKTPIAFKKVLESNIDKLSKYCGDIYEDNDDYAFFGVKIGVLAAKLTEVKVEEQEKIVVKDSIYQSFLNELTSFRIDAIEKSYLYEACECAIRNNRLAASTLLGCAAEYLLIKLCQAYYEYLKNNGTPVEISNFEKKVIKAKCAYDRLDEFEKRIESNIELFKGYGFENPKLNFNFLDIIRQMRNNAGHPTGKLISENDLKTLFGNYQHFIKPAHKMIKDLPSY